MVRDIEAEAIAALEQIAAQKSGGKSYVEGGNTTFSTLLDMLIEEKKSGLKPLQLNSRKVLESKIKKYLRPKFGTWKLREFSEDHMASVQNLLKELAAGGMGHGTLGNVYSAFNQAFALAVTPPNPHKPLLPRNLMVEFGVKCPQGRPKESGKVISLKEVSDLIRAVLTRINKGRWGDRSEPTFLARAVLVFLGMFTAFRNEEVGGLRWANVDFKGRKIYMRDVLRAGVGHVREDSKTGKHGLRGFPLSPVLAAVLLMYRQRMESILKRQIDDDDFVLTTGAAKRRPVTTQAICIDHWPVIAHKAGFIDANGKFKYTYYDLRHTFANMHEKIGIPLFRVSKMLGHRTSRTTEESYLHDTREVDEYDIIVAQVNAFIAAHPVLAGRTIADLIDALGHVLTRRWQAEGIEVGCAPLRSETPQIGYNEFERSIADS